MANLLKALESAASIAERENRRDGGLKVEAGDGTKLRRVSLAGDRIRAVRSELGMTQVEFSNCFGFDVESLRRWEQGRGHPEPSSAVLLEMISVDSKAVQRLLQKAVKSRSELLTLAD